MGRRINTITNWIAITTIFAFVFGLLYLSPLYFVLGLAVLGLIGGVILAILNDWENTIFRSEDRFRISIRKDERD